MTQKPPLSQESNPFAGKLSQRNKFITTFFAGAVAGAVAKTLIAPLDRTKINFQVTEQRFSLLNVIKFLRNSIQTGGYLSLYRGNTATMLRILPYSAIQFASHEQYKHFLGVDALRPHETAEPMSSIHIRRYLAGSLAGVTSVVCTYPLDFTRARMAVTGPKTYRNILHALRTVMREEGFLALYRGMTPTLLGSIPYAGTAFFTFETLKDFQSRRSGHVELSPQERLVCGALAGLLGQTSSYPLDIARRRMQTGAVTGHHEYSRGIYFTLKSVYQTEGVLHGWYKGLSMNFIKGPIAAGTSFTVVELLQKRLRRLSVFHDQ